MHVRPFAAALLVGLMPLAARPAAAQSTRDEPRIVFTVGLGYAFGRDLWSVTKQPYSHGLFTDSFNISRKFTTSFNAYLSATYFKNRYLGLTGEFAFIGLPARLSCSDAFIGGSPDTKFVCTALEGTTTGGSAVLMSFGPVFRVNSRGLFSPFIQANAGLVIGAASTMETSTTVAFTGNDPSLVQIYPDSRGRRIMPGFLLAGGFVVQASPGYIFKLELRDNLVRVREVTATTPTDGLEPPSRAVFRHVPVISLGIGVVLERRRGRRY